MRHIAVDESTVAQLLFMFPL